MIPALRSGRFPVGAATSGPPTQAKNRPASPLEGDVYKALRKGPDSKILLYDVKF